MLEPTFRYNQDPFGLFQNSDISPQIRYYSRPIEEKSNFKGLFIALSAILFLIILYVYRRTIIDIGTKILSNFTLQRTKDANNIQLEQ